MIRQLITQDEINKRVIGLDIIRAVAVIMVVFFHSRMMLLPLIDIPLVGFVIGKVIAIGLPFGQLGVEMFFVLSGYLIGGILIREFQRNDHITFNVIISFWIRRWFRTLPNYFLILALTSLLYFYLIHLQFDWRYLFFIQNFFSPHPVFFNEAWSLSIEEWSYLAVPLSLFLFIRKTDNSSLRLKRIFQIIIVFLIAFNLLRIFNALISGYPDMELRKIVVFRLDAVVYGVLAAYIHLFYSQYIEKHRVKLLIMGLFLITGITLVNYLGLHPSFNYYTESAVFRFVSDAFLYTLIPVCFALITLYAAGIRKMKNGIIQSFFILISLISYSMYLTHFTLIGVPFFYEHDITQPFLVIGFFLVYWIVVVVVSAFIYRFYEKPFTMLRDKKFFKSINSKFRVKQTQNI